MCLSSVINEDVTNTGKGRKLGGGRSIRSILHHFLGMMLIFLENKSKQKQETIASNQRSEGEMRGTMNLPPPIFLFFIISSTYLHRVMIYYCYDAKDRMTGGMGR